MRSAYRRVFSAGVTLMLLAGASAGLLNGLKGLSEKQVTENRKQFEARRLREVLSSVEFDNEPLADAIRIVSPVASRGLRRVYRVRRSGRIVAFVLEFETPSGYSGPIRMLASVDTHGSLIASAVLEHRETPGLGDRIEASRSDWLKVFEGRKATASAHAYWRVRRDGGNIDALTGATVTSRSVAAGLFDALLALAALRPQLAAAKAGTPLVLRHGL